MENESVDHEVPTRREYVKYGGAVIGGGLLAGCLGGSSDGATGNESAGSNKSHGGPNGSRNNGRSYSVSMAPMGEVEFESVPQDIFTVMLHHADMALALGHGGDLNALFSPEAFGGRYNRFLKRLGGISVEWANLYDSWNPTKEHLYALNSDVHLADPAYISATMKGWDNADIKEIRKNIAPWFGNTFSGQHKEPPEAWDDRYQYYSLWQIFGKVAQVLKEEKRYRSLADVHSNLVSNIKANLPPEDERPRTAKLVVSLAGDKENIWAYSMNGPGFYRAHTRPLGAVDALPNMGVGRKIDLEVLVEADLDVILCGDGISPIWPRPKRQLEDNPVAQQIPAVKNGRVYPQGLRYGGPIMNIFQLEMGAKQLYPDQFGKWPQYDGGSYPKIPADERMFDRKRVANIVNGDF